MRVDVVGEREQRLLVAGVPLHRDLERPVVGLALEEDRLLVQRVLGRVQVGDEVDDPALGVELLGLPLAALVVQRDPQPPGQERGLAHPLGQRREVVLDVEEDLGVGQEADQRPGGLARGALGQLVLRLAALVVLVPDVTLAVDLEMKALGERVDDRDADAVEAAGDLVAAAVAELAAGVKDGEDDLGGGPPLLLEDADRDAAAVVDDGDRVVGMDRHLDRVAVPGQRLVDGVVDDLVDEVMKATHPGRADVHAGALADRLEALEDGDVLRSVTVLGAALTLRVRVLRHSFLPVRVLVNDAVPGGGSRAAAYLVEGSSRS